jgi:hypothetical protein
MEFFRNSVLLLLNFYFIKTSSNGMIILKLQKNVVDTMEKGEFAYISDWNVNWYNHYGKHGSFSKIMEMKLT